MNQPIFYVYLNGAMIGGSASLSDGPYNQFSTLAGVTVRNGLQKLKWRLSESGGKAGFTKYITEGNFMKIDQRRRAIICVATIGAVSPLIACGKGKVFMRKEVTVNVVVFNYLEFPIYDVYLDKKMVGGSASLADSPYGQFSTVVGIEIPLGPQDVNWRSATTGETFLGRNKISLTEKDIPDGVRALGIHIYPDNTYELIFSDNVLEQSDRGLSYAKRYQKN